MKLLRPLLILFICFLAACSSLKPKEVSPIKGVSKVIALKDHLYKVIYTGFEYTQFEEVEVLALKAAAKYALKKGYKYLIVYQQNTTMQQFVVKRASLPNRYDDVRARTFEGYRSVLVFKLANHEEVDKTSYEIKPLLSNTF